MFSANEKIARFDVARGTLRRSPARTLITPDCVMHRPTNRIGESAASASGLLREHLTGQPDEPIHVRPCNGVDGSPGAAMRPALVSAFRQAGRHEFRMLAVESNPLRASGYAPLAHLARAPDS